MISPEFPPNEAERQIALEKYKLLDTLQEDAYDSITALISYICDVPIALITLLDKDRNYVKSNYGISITESPRSTSFCGHAIHSNDAITIVEDAREDIRFIGNPLVVKNNAIFYAGAPLVDADGFKLGVLCVYDHKPRILEKAQKEALLTLSKQVVHLFEQRYQNFKLEEFQTQLKKRNNNLEKFSGIVSHDLKSPLSNIMALTELLEQENAGKLNQNSLQYLEYLKESSSVLKDYIDGLLAYYKSDELLNSLPEKIDIKTLIDEVKLITDSTNALQININTRLDFIFARKSSLMQIFNNLISNAVKYNAKDKTVIDIDLLETDCYYEFSVKDNANGIPEKDLKSIFELFTTVTKKDKYGNKGTGIGLATVKRIIDHLNGSITVNSKLEQGSVFTFTIAKK